MLHLSGRGDEPGRCTGAVLLILNDKCSFQHRFVSSLIRLAIQQYKIEAFTSVARWPKWLRQAQEPKLS